MDDKIKVTLLREALRPFADLLHEPQLFKLPEAEYTIATQDIENAQRVMLMTNGD